MPPGEQNDLFDAGPAAPIDVAPEAKRWDAAAGRLPAGVRMGTSSWAFPGWSGRVWDREAPERILSRQGLTAYARHPLLRAVAIDRGYYGPIEVAAYRAWADQTPADFRFIVKADRRLVFPDGPDSDPHLYLNPAWAEAEVMRPAFEGLGQRLGGVLLQFPPVSPARVGGARAFAEQLNAFLHALPAELRDRLHVELRTPELLTADYRAVLAETGVSHGYVLHPEMVSLWEQYLAMGGAVSGGPTTLIRWMLASGYRYATAKEAWAPFRDLQRPDDQARSSVCALSEAVVAAGGQVIVIVNNKAEGCAPASIERLAQAFGDRSGGEG